MASTVLPCFPNTTRGQPTALKICEVRGGPKGKQLIYALDRVVVIRAIEPEAGAGAMYTQLYTQHAYPVSAVAMAPSGCYVASGDVNGVVRVWACDNPEQILKLETPVFGGRIAAIDWSMDNTRIVAVGDGKSDKAKAFMWDSGNSVGDLGGHAAKINTVSYKPSRPFRVVTGADDKKVNLYSGPPFKFTCHATQHGNFVNAVAYSPDGERFLTAASDSTVEVHDGKEGNKLAGVKARSRVVGCTGSIALHGHRSCRRCLTRDRQSAGAQGLGVRRVLVARLVEDPHRLGGQVDQGARRLDARDALHARVRQVAARHAGVRGG